MQGKSKEVSFIGKVAIDIELEIVKEMQTLHTNNIIYRFRKALNIET